MKVISEVQRKAIRLQAGEDSAEETEDGCHPTAFNLGRSDLEGWGGQGKEASREDANFARRRSTTSPRTGNWDEIDGGGQCSCKPTDDYHQAEREDETEDRHFGIVAWPRRVPLIEELEKRHEKRCQQEH